MGNLRGTSALQLSKIDDDVGGEGNFMSPHLSACEQVRKLAADRITNELHLRPSCVCVCVLQQSVLLCVAVAHSTLGIHEPTITGRLHHEQP